VQNPHRNLDPDDGLQMGGGKSDWVVPDGRINSRVFSSAIESSLLFRGENGASGKSLVPLCWFLSETNLSGETMLMESSLWHMSPAGKKVC